MTARLRISIVTPSYNQVPFLKECLLSVKEQSCPAIEQIVMDGGSTDGSAELLRDFSARPGWPHLRWFSECDRGQSDALNKAFRMANGDIIGWLNSDDFYLQGCFASVVEHFQRHPDIDVLYGDYFWTDLDRNPLQLRREIGFSKFVLSHGHVNYIQSSGAVFLSRRIIDEGHFLDEGYQYAMDYEYFLRLASCGYKFCHISAILCGFRWHPQSKTSAHTDKQFVEHEKARHANLMRQRKPTVFGESRIGLACLRGLADGRRWAEKALRGYYFSQYFPGRIVKSIGPLHFEPSYGGSTRANDSSS